MIPNGCGCRQCGGPAARDDALLAARVLAWAPFVAYRRGQSARDLANRCEPRGLYTRLVMEGARTADR